jgi:Ca-activated chloride channel homolog
MRFAHTWVLWLLLTLPLLGLGLARGRRRGERALAAALGPRMAARLTGPRAPRATGLRALLVLLALGCLILGAARPQRGAQYVAAKRTGGDVVIALDVSSSMLAEDLKPNRLQRARHEIASILDRLQGDRVGLVAFAGAAFVQCPLTLDYSAARMFLDFMGPDLIPEPGTDLGEALRVSTRAFGEEGEGYRALVLITDGEDHAGEVEAAAQEARKAGVRVFAVGIGSGGGEPIPERDAAGKVTGFKQDREGRVVMSRLHEDTLRQIAETTGGIYVAAGSTLGLDRVIDEIDRLEKRELAGGIRVLYEERYRYFVWPALLMLLLEAWVPLRRRARGGPRPAGDEVKGVPRGAGAAAALLMLLLAAGAGAMAPGVAAQSNAPAPMPPQANPPAALPAGWSERLAENEVFRERHPGDPRPLFNLGNLYHEQGDFARSEEFYQASLAHLEGEAGARAYYNLGNTLFRAGRLPEARDAFLESLRRDPKNEDAKQNLELTQKMLDQRSSAPDSSNQQQQDKQQQQQQQNQQQNQQQQQQQQNQQQNQQQQNQQQDQQQQQQQQQQDQQQQQQQQQNQQQTQQQQQDRQQQDQQRQQQSEASASPDSTQSVPLNEVQLNQLLRGLENEERELLERRFQARARRLDTEKDW